MYQILQSPNELLRTPTKPVDPAMSRLNKIIEEMKQTLIAQKDPEGVGLAANQVGLPYRLFLARFELPTSKKTLKKDVIHDFINPEILAHSEDFQPADKQEEDKSPLEGCLSLPKYYGLVKRWKWVKVKYQRPATSDQHLEEKVETFSGFSATVIQHEMDHLDGRIFVERILEQNGKLYKSVGKNKKGKDIWDEVEI